MTGCTRNKASNLRHQLNDPDLSDISGFSAHVRAGNDLKSVLLSIELNGVGNEIDLILFFDARVSRIDQVNFLAVLAERRSNVISTDRRRGKGDETVQLGENSKDENSRRRKESTGKRCSSDSANWLSESQ